MLSFEWQTQGRPLNSFIVGFKTLHFKKYKSYSQMNEGERGIDERGFWCVPLDGTSWIHLPKLLNSALQRDGSFVPMTQLCTHCTHLGTFDFLHNALAYKQLEMLFGMTMRAVARGRSGQTLDKPSLYDSHNLFCNSHLCYKFPALSPPYRTRDFSVFSDTLERKVNSPWPEFEHLILCCIVGMILWFSLYASRQQQSHIWY